jgi:hypothetical protein
VAEHAQEGGLQGSVVLLLAAAVVVTGAWLSAITENGVLFFGLAFTAPAVAGAALVVAASRRQDVFGTVGLVGAVAVLAASFTLFFGALVGLVAIAVAVRRRQPQLLVGIALILAGMVALLIGIEESEDAYTAFLPVIAIGLAVLAFSLGRLDA